METQAHEEHSADFLLDHIESPYHKGRIERSTATRTERNAVCGDVVELQIVVDRLGRVREAWFDGRGCLLSQAAASMLCEHIEGRTVAELEVLQPDELLDLVDIPLTPLRRQCALLAFRAIKSLLAALHPDRERRALTGCGPGGCAG
ncbi:MAG: iron-sulfur cluster assembly scaffold protein [Planctomycetes bacterium]|nr:iron-sulfur cluster assembly scaffold protein [Planctomycetota bacterium]